MGGKCGKPKEIAKNATSSERLAKRLWKFGGGRGHER
jgi:hypothetical protein